MEWESESPCRSHMYLGQGCRSPRRLSDWELEEILAQSRGDGCCWLQRDGARGGEGGDCGGKCLWRKARQPWKQGDTAESCIGSGVITVASLFSQASNGSWTIEGLALTQPCQSKEKQTNKNSAQISPYKLTETTGPTLGGQKSKGFGWIHEDSTLNLGKGGIKHNTTQIKEQTRNRELQIKEREIGKLPEK